MQLLKIQRAIQEKRRRLEECLGHRYSIVIALPCQLSHVYDTEIVENKFLSSSTHIYPSMQKKAMTLGP